MPSSRLQIIEQVLADRYAWRNPERVFVGSMADLMHESEPNAFIDRVFHVGRRWTGTSTRF
jgi:protein gp37